MEKVNFINSNREQLIWLCDMVVEAGILLYILTLPFDHIASLSAVSLILIVSFWIIKMIITKDFRLRPNPLNVPLFIFVSISLASAFVSIDPLYSLDFIRSEILKYTIIFLGIYNFIKKEDQIRRLVYALLIPYSIMIIYGLFEYFTELSHIGEKLDATLGHHNKFGMYSDLIFPLIIVLFLWFKKPRSTIPLGILIILSTVTIIFAQSRGSWIAILFSLIIIGIILEKRLLALILIGFLIFPFFLPGKIIKRFKSIFNFNEYLIPRKVLIERPFVWQASLKMIKKNPFLGAGTGTDIFYKLYVENGYKPKEAKQELGHAHNQLLQITVENGLLGLLSFLWIFTIIFKKAFSAVKRFNYSFEKFLIVGISSGIVGIFIHGIVGSFMRSRMGILLWVMVGLLFTLIENGDMKQEEFEGVKETSH